MLCPYGWEWVSGAQSADCSLCHQESGRRVAALDMIVRNPC